MANTRFWRSTDNRFFSTSPQVVIINGTAGYTNAPAKVEDAQFPMSNLLIPGRYNVWATPVGTTPSQVRLDFDAFASIIPVFVGFFGIRTNSLSSISFDLGSQNGYDGNAAFTSIKSGVIGSSTRDQGFLITGAPAGNTYRINFTGLPAAGVSFGTIFLTAVAVQDLGILYAPGMEEDIIHATIASRTGGGHLSVVSVGDTRSLVTMPFRNVSDTIKSKLTGTFGKGSSRDPAVWMDYLDVAKQVVLANGDIAFTHSWAAPNLWDCDLELEVLG